MMTELRLVAALLAVVALTSCSRGSGEPAKEREAAARQALGEVAVGAPCKPEDGWTPAPIQAAPDSTDPVAVAVPPDHVEYHQVAAGVLYCGGPSAMYPHGYFTANCAADSDCPNGSLCDGSLCRAPCETDAECKAPTRCIPTPTANGVRYCARYDAPGFKPRAR